MAGRGRNLTPLRLGRFVPTAYLLASRLESKPEALARYMGDRLLPLALVAAAHHRSFAAALWAVGLWLAYMGVYELFYAWNDRRGVPSDRRVAAHDAVLSAASVASRVAWLVAIVAAWQHACEAIDPGLFLVGLATVAVTFTLHNMLPEARGAGVKTLSFGILAALQFMPVAALLLPMPALLAVWLVHLLADACPRTADYFLRKRARIDAPARIALYRRAKMAGLLLGLAAAMSFVWVRYSSEAELKLLVALYALTSPVWRAAATLTARLIWKQGA